MSKYDSEKVVKAIRDAERCARATVGRMPTAAVTCASLHIGITPYLLVLGPPSRRFATFRFVPDKSV